jgi:hypothetical protein
MQILSQNKQGVRAQKVGFLLCDFSMILVVDGDYNTVRDRLFRLIKKTFCRQVLKLEANEASAQRLQNAL